MSRNETKMKKEEPHPARTNRDTAVLFRPEYPETVVSFIDFSYLPVVYPDFDKKQKRYPEPHGFKTVRFRNSLKGYGQVDNLLGMK